MVLKDTDWLPWYLGGQNNGQLVNTCKNLPFLTYNQDVLDYGLYTFGYHFGDMIHHLVIAERHGDFEEMLLHHIATSSLYFGYIFSNHIGIGSVIAFLHDIADIFV